MQIDGFTYQSKNDDLKLLTFALSQLQALNLINSVTLSKSSISCLNNMLFLWHHSTHRTTLTPPFRALFCPSQTKSIAAEINDPYNLSVAPKTPPPNCRSSTKLCRKWHLNNKCNPTLNYNKFSLTFFIMFSLSLSIKLLILFCSFLLLKLVVWETLLFQFYYYTKFILQQPFYSSRP